MAKKRVLVAFELEIDESDFDKLMPHALGIEDGKLVSINMDASCLGPLGDGIFDILRSASSDFSFGPYGVLDMDENAEQLQKAGLV